MTANVLSPVETLRAAAAKLREIGSAATPGPWRTHDAHLGNTGGYAATVLTGKPGSGDLVAWLPTFSETPWDRQRNVWNDSAWIALVHPGLAEPLAEVFEKVAWAVNLDEHLIGRVGYEETLRLARKLLGVPDAG